MGWLKRNGKLLLVLAVIAGMVALQWLGRRGDNRIAPPGPDSLASASEQRRALTGEGDSERSGDGGVLAGPVPGAASPAPGDDVEAKQRVFREWMFQRGFYSSADLQGYATYDLATLQQLAAGGDLLANTVLYSRYVKDGQVDRAHETAYNGAVLGSLQNLRHLAGPHLDRAREFRGTNGPAAEREVLDVLTWYQVAMMRGDQRALRDGLRVIEEYGLELDDGELRVLEGRAAAIYAGLENARLERGLGPFDNSAPPVQFVEPGDEPPSGWGSGYYRRFTSGAADNAE
ncbi:hypothetical protein [Microbulbifer sediminum]|uniref:hypothetical protein n=1 Tax=Microbulbifer sediminum TaxID=2904250 RepID=UPI001F3521DB|nr:hypothetical protein [Microbulbifer sediminum]